MIYVTYVNLCPIPSMGTTGIFTYMSCLDFNGFHVANSYISPMGPWGPPLHTAWYLHSIGEDVGGNLGETHHSLGFIRGGLPGCTGCEKWGFPKLGYNKAYC